MSFKLIRPYDKNVSCKFLRIASRKKRKYCFRYYSESDKRVESFDLCSRVGYVTVY